MTAMLAPASLVLAAIAIDFGALYTQRRELQSLADLSAISAAAHLDSMQPAVLATLSDNGRPSAAVISGPFSVAGRTGGQVEVRLQPGHYTGSAGIAAASRFVAGQTPYNAAQVALQEQGRRIFATWMTKAPVVATHGVARITAMAAFSIGSRLAALDGGIANALLGGLLGGNVSLQLMDYQALLKADIDLFNFLDILAVKANLTALTYSDLLASDVAVGKIAAAMAEVPGLDSRSSVALRTLGLRADSTLKVKLGKVLDLGEAGYLSLGGRPAGLSAAANALQILTGAATLANGTNQITLNIGVTLPGITSATLDLAVGEPAQMSPWFRLGEAGAVVRTAQTRLLLSIDVLGPGGVLGTSIKLPIYLEIAYGEASLVKVSCPDGRPASTKVTVAATPGVAELRIAGIDAASFRRFDRSPVTGPATLVKLPAVTVTGSALAQITNTGPKNLEFTRADIDAGTIKKVSTRNAAQTLTASLLGNLALTVKLAGIDLGLGNVLKATLGTTLTAVSPSVDLLLNGVLDTLGVTIGEADIRVHGASCGRAVLVQ
ncbi:MAG: hypothetical protein KF914_12880 [Rhizobiaceae bacterium]|nr:hypothetical protein [Rhizobiaceae bacterium]